MEFEFQKLLAGNNISESELTDDIKIGIKSIKGQERAINMREKGGKNVAPSQLEKIKREDKVVTRDIQEFIDAKNKGGAGDAAAEKEKARLAEEERLKKEKQKKDGVPDADLEVSKQKGLSIDKELEPLLKSGKTSLTLEEIKTSAPTAYVVIFDTYTSGTLDNGVITSNFSLLETEKEKFTLSKK